MTKKNLTDVTIKRLKPPEKGQITITDTKVKGLELRCSMGGTKSFTVQYGLRTKRKRKTIGQYPIMSLAEAREVAQEFLHGLKHKPNRPASPPFGVAVERYLRLKEPELRPGTYKQYKRLLEKHFSFESVLIEDISTAQVANSLDAINARSERSHAYTAIKIFFNWCIEREYCETNPLAKLRKPKVGPARERVLDDGELRAIWSATGTMRKYGEIVRVLMLTGQRAGQIARLHESWIDQEEMTIHFPASVMKNGLAHSIPYGSMFKTAVMLVKPVEGWFFSPPGLPGVAFSAWSKNKKKLDDLLPDMEPWTLHDLRRTWSTIAASQHIPPHIIDRYLSHVSGSISSVSRIYNRHGYVDEMRTAMETVEKHLNHVCLSR